MIRFLIVAVPAGLLLGGYALLRAWLSHLSQKHGAGVVAWRFATGQHLDGKARTDAGFTRRGTRILTHTGHATRWAHLPHVRRAALRWALCVTPVALLAGFATDVLATLTALACVTLVALALFAALCVRLARAWSHRRGHVRPLAKALSPVLGVSPPVAEAALSVTRGYADADGGDKVAHLVLPEHFHADEPQRATVEHLFTARLGIDTRLTWHTSKAPMFAEVARRPTPPDVVWLADVMTEIEACRPGQVVLGRAASRKVYLGDFLREDPHWGISAGTRRGKTTLLSLTAAQVLRQARQAEADLGIGRDSEAFMRAKVLFIDPKRAMDALVGVPGVEVRNDPRDVEAMWAAITGFRAELDARIEARGADPTLEFPRRLLVIDELNQFSAQTLDRWRDIRDKSDPARPPVWRDVAAIGWMGAQYNTNIIVAGQRLDAQATGGANIRDSLGIRMLGGFTPQQWGFLVGTWPVPKSHKARGRFIVVNGGEQTWVQLVRVPDGGEGQQAIRDLAMTPVRMSPEMSPVTPLPGSMPAAGQVLAPVWVTLQEASADLGEGIVPMKYEALKKAASRNPDSFPAGRPGADGRSYDAAELTAWHTSRKARA